MLADQPAEKSGRFGSACLCGEMVQYPLPGALTHPRRRFRMFEKLEDSPTDSFPIAGPVAHPRDAHFDYLNDAADPKRYRRQTTGHRLKQSERGAFHA